MTKLSYVGPLVTDAEFFSQLDGTKEELKEVVLAAQRQDFAAARTLFAAYARKNVNPEKYFAAKGKTDDYTPRQKEHIFATAQNAEKHLLVSCTTPMQYGETIDWFYNPTYNKYCEWTWQLSRHDEFVQLAAAYRLTGDARWAKAFADLFGSWVKQAVCPPPQTSGYATLCWRTIECGIRMGGSWQIALHTFIKSPEFTDDLIVDWYKSVYEHGCRLRRNHRTGNWLIMEMNGLFNIGLLYPCFANSQAWLQYALQTLCSEMKKQTYPDGFQYELSTEYQRVVITNYAGVARLAKAYDVVLPGEYMAGIENMCSVYVKLLQPGMCCPDINDGANYPAKFHLQMVEDLLQGEAFRWVVSDKETGRQPEYTSIALPYSGFMVMRSGWQKDDIWGMLDAAPFGTGHQHEDKLNFMMCVGEKYVVAEANRFAYDTSEMRKYILSTRGHNTVRVNGQDQNRRKTYAWHDEDIAKESGMRCAIGDEMDFAAGVYDEGYGENQDTGVTHARSVIFVKKPHAGRPFFVIIDRLLTQAPENTYETLWHFDCERLSAEKFTLTAEGVKVFTNLQDDKKTWLRMVRGEHTPEWQGWIARTVQQGNEEPMWAASFMQKAGSVRNVTLLCPTGDDGSCQITGVQAGSDPADREICITFADGTKTVLSEEQFA